MTVKFDSRGHLLLGSGRGWLSRYQVFLGQRGLRLGGGARRSSHYSHQMVSSSVFFLSVVSSL